MTVNEIDQATPPATRRTGVSRAPLVRHRVGRPVVVAYAIVLAIAMALPFVLGNYYLLLANIALVYAIIGIGLTMLLGWTGQFAFISTAFFGFGAYTGARLGAALDLPIEAAIAVGVVASAVVGLGFGAAAVRLRGYYLSIVTIASMFMLDYAYRNLPNLTGGVRGFIVPIPYSGLIGGIELGSYAARFYFGLALLVIVFAAATLLRASSIGRAWQSLRVNPAAAAALGIDVYRQRLLAFVVGAIIFGAAGVWFAYVNRRVFPESYGMGELIFHFLIVVIGGMGSLRGAVVAAVLLVVARELLRGFVGLSEITFGVVLLLSVLFMRRGIYGTLAERWRALREPYL